MSRLDAAVDRLYEDDANGHDVGVEGAAVGIMSLIVGHVHPFPVVAAVEPALGVRVSGSLVDEALESRYGTRFPLGVMAYVRLTPANV